MRPLHRWFSQPTETESRKTTAERAVIRSTLVHAGYSEDEAYRLADKPGFTQFDADLLVMTAKDGAL